MKRRKQKKMSSNRGYSLIELIVTVLISSIIVVAVVGFLSTGLRHYRNVNSEALLQMESQVTELFITELFQEAEDFRVIDSTSYPTGEGVSYVVEIQRDVTYLLALKEGELWFSEVTVEEGDTDTAIINKLLSEGRSRAFLAKYVSNFQLSGSTTFSGAVGDDNGLVFVRTEFKVDGKQYDNDMLIALRNARRN